jgi:hypothetical protein
MQEAAPVATLIPGVGTLAGAGLGALGSIAGNVLEYGGRSQPLTGVPGAVGSNLALEGAQQMAHRAIGALRPTPGVPGAVGAPAGPVSTQGGTSALSGGPATGIPVPSTETMLTAANAPGSTPPLSAIGNVASAPPPVAAPPVTMNPVGGGVAPVTGGATTVPHRGIGYRILDTVLGTEAKPSSRVWPQLLGTAADVYGNIQTGRAIDRRTALDEDIARHNVRAGGLNVRQPYDEWAAERDRLRQQYGYGRG